MFLIIDLGGLWQNSPHRGKTGFVDWFYVPLSVGDTKKKKY